MKVVGDEEGHNIEDIDIIRSLFPDNKEVVNRVNTSLAKLKNDITQLIQTVEDIKSIEDKLNTTSQIGRLLVFNAVKQNITLGLYLKKKTVISSDTAKTRKKHTSRLCLKLKRC